MTVVLDQAHDTNGQELHRLTLQTPAPEFVKQASRERICGEPSQPSHLFADPVHRLFPMHTAPAVWASTLFLEEKRAELAPERAQAIEANLNAAADWFGIRPRVDEIRQKAAASQAQADVELPDTAFAVVWQDAEGQPPVRHWRMLNAKEASAAAQALVQHRDDFEYTDRRTVARKILTKAAEFAADLGDAAEPINQMAGFGTAPIASIAEQLEYRSQLLKRSHTDYSVSLAKVAAALLANVGTARTPERLNALAGVLDQCDRETGLAKFYGQGLSHPEAVCFAVTEKTAADAREQLVATIDGTVFERDALEKLSIAHIRDWMGDEFANAVTTGGFFLDGEKLAAIVPTLDRPSARMFEQMVGAAAKPAPV